VWFRQAEDFELELLQQVRDEYHAHLRGFDIGMFFRSANRKSAGMQVLAQAVKPSEEVAFLTGLDGWIEVAAPTWDRYGANLTGWREFLLDHELSHFWVARGGLTVVGHPFEDFPMVLGRHDPEVTGLAKLLRVVGLANGSGNGKHTKHKDQR